jgi:hypothetical protein
VSVPEEVSRVSDVEHSTNEDPRQDGDVIPIGPGCFAVLDGSVLNWRGVNYVPQDDHRGAVKGAVAQTDNLMRVLENDLNDVGPWGSGYRRAMADLREQLALRFGGQ